MNIKTKTTDVLLTRELSDHLNKKLEKISHLLEGDPSIACDVELKRTTKHHNKGDVFMAEIHIVGRKRDVFARAERSDLFIAIDEVTDEAFHSLTSRHKKYIALARRGGARVKDMIKGLWPAGKSTI